jgi:DNA-directed RNA polymerase specialized sigma24 family protein
MPKRVRRYADDVTSKGRPVGLRVAFEQLRDHIAADADAVTAFHLATELRDEADALVSDAAVLRARMALRVMETEGLSLAQLAERLGTSKSRADQFVRAARDAGGVAS